MDPFTKAVEDAMRPARRRPRTLPPRWRKRLPERLVFGLVCVGGLLALAVPLAVR